MSEPIPTPWETAMKGDGSLCIHAPPDNHHYGPMVADNLSDDDAILIVRAVNAYGPLVEALTLAYRELNDIRARDGVPRMYDGGKAGVSETCFSAVVDQCWAALTAAGVVNEQLHDIEQSVKLAAGRAVEKFMPKDIGEDTP